MATVLQLFGANTAITVTGLATAADDATVVSDEIDNSSRLNLSDDIQIELTGTGNGRVNVYLMRANDTGVYPSTDVFANLEHLTSVHMSATTPKVNFRIEQLPEFYKLVFHNDSGAALTAAVVKRQSADVSNA